MCFLTIEDLGADIECIVFSKQYAERVQLLQAGNIVLIRGRLSLREEREPSVICESIEPNPKNILRAETKTPQKKRRNGIFLKLPARKYDNKNKVDTLLSIFDGNFPVYAYYADEGKYELLTHVSPNEALTNELETILGSENVVVRS